MMNRTLKKLFANPLFIAGSLLALFFLFLSLFGVFFLPHDPLKPDIWNTLLEPNKEYPLGTDNLGRCVFSRLAAGTRITLSTALMIELLILSVGTLAGICAGYFGGIIDGIILTIIDILLAFPGIILALVIAGFLGAGLENLIIAFAAVFWVEPARIARNITIDIKEKDFILSSRALGSSPWKIIRLHLLPHLFPNMLIHGTLHLSAMIIALSSMSFIGLGVKPPAPEWGALLSEGRLYMRENPRMILAAVLCIMLAAACFQFLGESLRDTLDPRKSHLREKC
ncbi:glutathione ABC transporter permease GsiD [Spirochaetia bacterium]|nr:glutathione ABC transporter permease GsiD [Spirochaetia bacterium]